MAPWPEFQAICREQGMDPGLVAQWVRATWDLDVRSFTKERLGGLYGKLTSGLYDDVEAWRQQEMTPTETTNQ